VARVLRRTPGPVHRHREGRQPEVDLDHLQAVGGGKAQRRASRQDHRQVGCGKDRRRDHEVRQRQADARLQPEQVQHARGLGVAVHEHELQALQHAAVAQPRRQRVARAQQHDVALLQDGQALRPRQRRQVADRQVQPPILERRRHGLGRHLHRLQTHAGRLAADGGHQRRQEFVGADVAHVHDEAPLRVRRIEALRLGQRDIELAQRGVDRTRELVGARGRRHAPTAAREERVTQRQAQPRQRVADGGLAEPERLRRTADAARRVHRRKDMQQVQVEVTDIHCVHGT